MPEKYKIIKGPFLMKESVPGRIYLKVPIRHAKILTYAYVRALGFMYDYDNNIFYKDLIPPQRYGPQVKKYDKLVEDLDRENFWQIPEVF